MQLTNLVLKNFRCFKNLELKLEAPIILIEGENGSGKTSILEALHYLCYLKSFRTHLSKDLIKLESENFFIKINFSTQEESEIQAGFSGKKKSVKMNNKPIQSYKELVTAYRSVALTEDDINLIKGGPDCRRAFIDQYIHLYDTQFLALSKNYKQIVDNKNALLQNPRSTHESYTLWNDQLKNQSLKIQETRKAALKNLEDNVNTLLLENFDPNLYVQFKYEEKIETSTSFEREKLLGRSLFGAHLDDFSIVFCDKKSRTFASRGQQKLLITLMKVAQVRQLIDKTFNNGSILFLIDDFMTDLDANNMSRLAPILLSLNTQLIFTCPLNDSPLKKILLDNNAQIIKL
ncbi:MAG: DNA replication and repair protein RecF [Candidatus Babeliales bacterium]|nr:DNA replication and repair protein RecF [Candidatus Babeliales bacterium]